MKMRPAILAFVYLFHCSVAWAQEGAQAHAEAAEALIEIAPGVVMLAGPEGKLKLEPTLAIEVGASVPISKRWRVEVLGAYEVGSSQHFDEVFHGPGLTVGFMNKLTERLSLGLELRGGVGFKGGEFEGGWLAITSKLTYELSRNFELGLQAGPRLHLDSVGGDVEKHFGSDASGVVAVKF